MDRENLPLLQCICVYVCIDESLFSESHYDYLRGKSMETVLGFNNLKADSITGTIELIN